MKKLQQKINKHLEELRLIRLEKGFSKLSQEDKTVFYTSLKLLNDFEDRLIITYCLK